MKAHVYLNDNHDFVISNTESFGSYSIDIPDEMWEGYLVSVKLYKEFQEKLEELYLNKLKANDVPSDL